MDVIAEILLEFILELFVGASMESETLKTRTKTVIFLLVCGIVDALAGFFFWEMCFVEKNTTGSLLCGAVLLFMLGLTIFGAISGHRRNWKHD